MVILALDLGTKWRRIKGYPGYQISNTGLFKNSRGIKIPWINRRTGYPTVDLWKNNVGKKQTVSRLVALHFIPNPLGKKYVCHNDGNKLNNKYTNLYWGTAEENGADRRRHGTDALGENNPMAKLSNKQVASIRELKGFGLFAREVALRFKVSRQCINDIWTGKRHADTSH